MQAFVYIIYTLMLILDFIIFVTTYIFTLLLISKDRISKSNLEYM